MKKVVILVRVSTNEQNYDSQTSELIELVKADYKADYNEDNIIIIADKESATKLTEEERQGLTKLYAAIEKYKIEAVYVWELSRLSRIPETLYKIKKLLKENKINLIVKDKNFRIMNNIEDEDSNFENTVNNLAFGLFISLIENEGDQRIARVKRAKKQLAVRCHYNGGVRRYGYQINSNKDYEAHPTESEVVKLIFELYATRKFGTGKLHKELQERGINIQKRLIESILTSKCYTGELIPEQTYKEGNKKITLYARRYPQIITPELFEKCREVANENNSNIDKSKTTYYGNKLIKCPVCGRNIQPSKTALSYYCKHKYKGLCTCTYTININILDTVLWNVARDMEHRNLSSEHFAAIEEIKRQIASLQNKIDNCGKRYKDKLDEECKPLRKKFPKRAEQEIIEMGIEVLEEFKIQLDNEKEDYQNQVKQLIVRMKELEKQYNSENSIVENFENIYQLIDTYDDKQRYDCIHKHIKSVHIDVKDDYKIINVDLFNDECDTILNEELKLEHDKQFVYNNKTKQLVEVNHVTGEIADIEIIKRFTKAKS